MAVAFSRVENVARAIQTYEEAIQLSRQQSDWVNLSRWCQNLGLLLLERNDLDGAAVYLKEALRAASLSNVAYQISTAQGNYAGLLARKQRYGEAVEYLDRAAAAAEKPKLALVWQSQRVTVLLNGPVAKPTVLRRDGSSARDGSGPCRTSRGVTLRVRSCSGRSGGIAATG